MNSREPVIAAITFGGPDRVADHVRQTFAAFARPEGGYIGYGRIGPDVPLANAEAMLRTFGELMPTPERRDPQ